MLLRCTRFSKQEDLALQWLAGDVENRCLGFVNRKATLDHVVEYLERVFSEVITLAELEKIL